MLIINWTVSQLLFPTQLKIFITQYYKTAVFFELNKIKFFLIPFDKKFKQLLKVGKPLSSPSGQIQEKASFVFWTCQNSTMHDNIKTSSTKIGIYTNLFTNKHQKCHSTFHKITHFIHLVIIFTFYISYMYSTSTDFQSNSVSKLFLSI